MRHTFTGMFPPTPTILQARWCLWWVFNSAPVFSLCSPHTYRQGWVCECVCVSLHSALNEPIIGVYVALMCVSVRRETLHHSPPNQWGLACYTTPRFFSLTCPLSHHSFLISALHFLSIFLQYLSSLLFLLCSISRRQAWGIRSIGHEESFKQSKMRLSLELLCSGTSCTAFQTVLQS